MPMGGYAGAQSPRLLSATFQPMNEDVSDDGLSVHGLWAWAWVLGIAAGGSLLRLLTYAADGAPVQTELFVWVLLGVIAAAFSACCAVLAGIKSVERRLTARLTMASDR
jgi:hypothetical protein